MNYIIGDKFIYRPSFVKGHSDISFVNKYSGVVFTVADLNYMDGRLVGVWFNNPDGYRVWATFDTIEKFIPPIPITSIKLPELVIYED